MIDKIKGSLHQVAASGDASTVFALLDQGQSVNALDASGLTALHRAVWNGHVEAAQALIQRGADINAKRVMAEMGNAWTPLHFAAENNRPECARLLLEAGADPDPKDEFGQTPLFIAAGQENNHEAMRAELVAPDVARLLIEYGASVYGTNAHHDWTGIDPDAGISARLQELELVHQRTLKMVW